MPILYHRPGRRQGAVHGCMLDGVRSGVKHKIAALLDIEFFKISVF